MRKLLVPAAAAAILATSAVALAATQHTTGTVKSFDSKAMTLTLADGTEYMLPKTFKNPGLKAGERVTVAWDMQGRQQDRREGDDRQIATEAGLRADAGRAERRAPPFLDLCRNRIAALRVIVHVRSQRRKENP